MPQETPTVVIVGRPNVGKSTLFNRITHGRRSIVGDEPGITRDRISGAANFEGRRFELVDTGGIVVNDADYIPTQILKQAKVALEHAARVLFVVDGRAEITSADRELAQLLRDVGLPHLVDRIDRDDNWPQSLSAGELQRIAVARALLAKPSWIFLDEATANLDPESESEIYAVLRAHLPDATLVAIAHGPSVADFHEGRILFERSGTSPGKLTMEAAA